METGDVEITPPQHRRLSDFWPSWRDFALDGHDYRAIFLFSGCFVYALFGSPTPEHPGPAEALICFFLALAIGLPQASAALVNFSRTRFWYGAGQAFLIYGLSVPLIVAAVSGHDMSAVLRDVIPFVFLFFPVFFATFFEKKPEYYRTTLFAVLSIGFLFGLRSLLMRDAALCGIWCTEELLYLENMPTVLFCALFLTGTACARVMRRAGPKDLSLFALLIVLALAPLAAMAITLQRASLGAFALYCGLIYLYLFYKRPWHALVLALCAFAAMTTVGMVFSRTIESLYAKTELVGLNMRPQEFRAVWDVVSANPGTLLFGIGWGGHFNSPAVNNLSVNFTHNFFTSVLLKTGLCGLLLSLGYMLGLVERLSRIVLRNPVLGLALAAPVLIDLSLYASFKSLDFGLVLLLIPATLIYSQNPNRSARE